MSWQHAQLFAVGVAGVQYCCQRVCTPWAAIPPVVSAHAGWQQPAAAVNNTELTHLVKLSSYAVCLILLHVYPAAVAAANDALLAVVGCG